MTVRPRSNREGPVRASNSFMFADRTKIAIANGGFFGHAGTDADRVAVVTQR